MKRQRKKNPEMLHVRCQQTKPARIESRRKKFVERNRKGELAQAVLNDDFPYRHMADELFVFRRLNGRARHGAKRRIALPEPKQGMSVEQHPHFM